MNKKKDQKYFRLCVSHDSTWRDIMSHTLCGVIWVQATTQGHHSSVNPTEFSRIIL